MTTNVALDTSITIDFSEALDPAPALPTRVLFCSWPARQSPAHARLSADRRRVVFRPASPLAGISSYTLALTAAVRDPSGNPLTGFTPISFTTLDPSRPAGPAPGQIIAELPDDDGVVLVTGAAGVAAANAAVTLTNLRTQETSTVLALPDGSFRLRVTALIGDGLVLSLRGPDGRDTTIAITQLVGPDGSTSIGDAGGTIAGPGGLIGTILPRSLVEPGVFRLVEADPGALPVLTAGLSYADAFTLTTRGATFRSLAVLTLAESQNRFLSASAFAPAFAASGELTTPDDALINSALRFSGVIQDSEGTRRTVSASTTIVATTPDSTVVETAHSADFPTIFIRAPREALPNQQVSLRAVAPTARVDLELPVPAGVASTHKVLLTRGTAIGSESRLLVVDQMSIVAASGGAVLRTTGRELPGMTDDGNYGIVAALESLTFVTGLASGAEAFVLADGLPFAARTNGPNGRFAIPVRAGQTFTLRFLSLDGQVRGSATGQAPATGSVDVGDPLGTTAGRLTIQAEPDERSVVDINAPVVLRFSEPVDDRTVSGALVVTDEAGSRVFGRVVVGGDGLSATFTPARRWRFGTTYRYGVGQSVLGRSGARPAVQFSGQFTTFRPAVIGTLALVNARDVAVSGGTAIVGTDTGFETVNVTSPRAPQISAHVATPGGAGAVGVLAGTPITDRNGATLNGPFALVGAGSPLTSGSIRTFDLSNPASPALLGSTQLTIAPGESPPPGVPAFAGTPRAIVSGPDGRAFVAVEGVGVSSVQIGQAIPLDVANSARGVGPRYPAGAESVTDIVQLGSRLLAAGAAGLTVLDQNTLARTGGVNTTGNAQGMAALAAFGTDVNGDNVVDPATEVFDLAAVANGLDGTLQFYRVPDPGDPVLISVVRFNGTETTSVKLDAVERLAYVGLAGRGVALVDLDGTPSVQPLDSDRNGIDDRVLGIVDTVGVAGRLALDLPRGVGYLANGPGGLAILQLLPPRTKFLTLKRDPVRVIPGEEQSVLDSLTAYVTDDALRLTLDVFEPPNDDVSLAIDESLESGGTRLVTFNGGTLVMPLASGLNNLELRIDGNVSASNRVVRLRVLKSGTELIASRTVQLVQPDPGIALLEQLQLGPAATVLTADAPTVRIGVAGFYDDGRVFNLSTAAATQYGTEPAQVTTVDPSGLVTGIAGGLATVAASHGAVDTTMEIRVQRERALIALLGRQTALMLRSLGEEAAFPLRAIFSDGTEELDAAQLPQVVFATSDSTLVSVSPEGQIRAVAEGVARVSASAGTLEATIDVAVDPRTPTSVTGLTIESAGVPLSLDDAPLFASATVAGTGALDGHPVTVAISRDGAIRTLALTTDLSGSVRFRLDDGVAGSISVTASTIDPATGNPRTAATAFLTTARTADNEPNGNAGAASPLRPDRSVDGTLDGNADRQDTYRVDSSVPGTLEINLRLQTGTTPQNVLVIVRNAAGQELARLTPQSLAALGTLEIPSGAAFVTVESLSGGAAYTLSTRFIQADASIAAVSPTSGGPGTLVTITGSGFSTRLEENQVFFSQMRAEVVSATATILQARVPASAVNGSLEVISGGRRAEVAMFSTGNASPRPPAYLLPADPAQTRSDPSTGDLLDITRLVIVATPSAGRQDVEQIAARVGGEIVGYVPMTNQYVLQFAQNRTLDGLTALRQRLATEPNVRVVSFSVYERLAALHPIDIFSVRSGVWRTNEPKRSGA